MKTFPDAEVSNNEMNRDSPTNGNIGNSPRNEKHGVSPGTYINGNDIRLHVTVKIVQDRKRQEQDLIPLNNKYQRGAGYKLPDKNNKKKFFKQVIFSCKQKKIRCSANCQNKASKEPE